MGEVTDAKITLKPCPFCGGEAMLIGGHDSAEVHCLPCTASVSEQTEAEAIAAWNTRAMIAASTPHDDGGE